MLRGEILVPTKKKFSKCRHFCVSVSHLLWDFWKTTFKYEYKCMLFQNKRVELKCTAMLGDFFMKSEIFTARDARTNFRTVEVKSDALNVVNSEKTLGLFEDNFVDEEVFLTRAQNNFSPSFQARNLYIFSLILTLVLNFCQVGKT